MNEATGERTPGLGIINHLIDSLVDTLIGGPQQDDNAQNAPFSRQTPRDLNQIAEA
jgi:hypothetical protein